MLEHVIGNNAAFLTQVLHGSAEVNGVPLDDCNAPNITTRLDVLGITPTSAVVRVTMENDAAGCDYTDFHSLIKIDGQWKLIAKLFHLYDK